MVSNLGDEEEEREKGSVAEKEKADWESLWLRRKRSCDASEKPAAVEDPAGDYREEEEGRAAREKFR